MSAVLNPELYRRLKERFGDVVIANQGQRAKVVPVRRGRRVVPEVGSGGEYYRVCCPMCPKPDRGFHLYISYRYGETVAGIPGQVLNGVICFRCNQRPGETYLGDMIRRNFAKLRQAPAEPIIIEDEPLKEVPMPPGTMVRLCDLLPEHPAYAYLANRNFDPVELSERFFWMFCQDSPEYYLVRRLFIPFYHEEDGQMRLVGYQSRAIPGFSAAAEPKYWFLPGFKKSRTLYNLYNARKHEIIVITEGVTDAARVGDSAVCLWGKSMSEKQIALLTSQCRHATAAVLLDSDAVSVSFDLANRLNKGGFSDNKLAGGAFPVRLPKGDPADYTREWLLNHIAASRRRR